MKNISAFPSEWSTFEQRGDPAYNPKTRVYHSNEGMTLRDYFAGQALAGSELAMWKIEGPGGLAENCYRVADAMLAEREKGERK